MRSRRDFRWDSSSWSVDVKSAILDSLRIWREGGREVSSCVVCVGCCVLGVGCRAVKGGRRVRGERGGVREGVKHRRQDQSGYSGNGRAENREDSLLAPKTTGRKARAGKTSREQRQE